MSGENQDWMKTPAMQHLKKALKAEAERSFAAPAGSLAHVHFEITTAAGNRAVIKGDPEMPEATRNALAQMIDALAKAVERGDFKKPENEKGQR